jgi:hypothetical protein
MQNDVRAIIEAGEHPLGTFFQLGNETAAECMGYGASTTSSSTPSMAHSMTRPRSF